MTGTAFTPVMAGDFNSHAHVERDYILNTNLAMTVISTHTLTWSVTVGNIYDNPELLNFNSHAHVERDIFPLLLILLDVDFNSHAHVERDT